MNFVPVVYSTHNETESTESMMEVHHKTACRALADIITMSDNAAFKAQVYTNLQVKTRVYFVSLYLL